LRPSLRLDLESIRHNVRVWREVLDGRPLLAVVKCDAYRMGMVPVAHAAVESGAAGLCVVEISEASELRAAGIDAPIVHVAATPSEDFVTGLEDRVALSVGDAAKAAELSRVAKKLGVRAQVHVAVETGTGWWGVPAAQAASFASDVASLDNLVWEGVWTHIAGPDSMNAQMDRFCSAVRVLRENGLAVPLEHAASTGPTLWGLAQGAARIGIGLYGSSLDCTLPGNQSLQTAFEVRAPVYAVRTFSESTPLGYGGTYTAQPGQTIATLRIGYGEGLPKALAGRGCAKIADAVCPIVGAIGMNFTMVAVPPKVRVDVGQDAVLAGDTPRLRIDDLAQAAATIPHNVVTSLGSGMTRVYSGNVDRTTLFARSD
jgi:alanine racemase